MIETFDYIAGGRLYAYDGTRSTEVRSSVLGAYIAAVRESARRTEWKRSGEGAKFLGSYDAHAGASEQVAEVHARFLAAARDGGRLLYSLAIDRTSGIYAARPDEPTDGIILANADTQYGEFDLRDGRMALTCAFAGESHIGVMALDRPGCRVYTEGHTRDTSPAWSASRADGIYFCCTGLPLDPEEASVSRAPTAICLLDIAAGPVEDVLCDEKYDYLAPQSLPDGSLWYLRRPYAPERMAHSFFQALALRLAGRPKKLQPPELRRLDANGTDTLVRRDVSAFRADADSVIAAVGGKLLRIADGKETVLAEAEDVTMIR